MSLENVEQQLKNVCKQQDRLDMLIRNHNNDDDMLDMLYKQRLECIKMRGQLNRMMRKLGKEPKPYFYYLK